MAMVSRSVCGVSLVFLLAACADDGGAEDTVQPTSFTPPTTETGDPMTGDGDGDPATGDGDGDGDTTTTTGDGDGEPETGDGDGDEPPPPECGNGIVEAGEACDDGNDIDDDECTNECQFPNCGDGVVQDGEECDVGNETMFCDGDCTYAMCGDGYHNMLSEECDDGNSNNDDACVGPCLANTCGDGYVYAGIEECDDGDEVDNNDCKNDCTNAICGDGVIWDGVEECEDGNEVDSDACTNECLNADCGDGIVYEGVEECDDANDDPYDDCTTACTVPTCGDGFLHPGEDCDGLEFGDAECADFGNFNSGDLICDDSCQIDSSDCTLGVCPGGGAFAEGYCWYASDVCETAQTKCASVGLVGPNGYTDVNWSQATMDTIADQLGLISGGPNGCCVNFGWIEDGTIYTHNFGDEFYNWPNCFSNNPTLKLCIAP